MGKFNFNQADFQKVREEAEKFYAAIGEIYCPYFDEKIVFNAKGLRHLKFKSNEQARILRDQYARLKLIYFVPELLRRSNLVQGIWRTRLFEAQRTNGQWRRIMKDVIFFEFIAVIKNVRIKVIVKEVLGGEKHFWSVIPFWGIDKENQKRILHSGDPEDD